MNRRTITLTTFVVIVAGLVFTQLASAYTISGFSIRGWYCDRVDYSAHTYTADRDNTGSNQEKHVITIKDSLGTILFSKTSYNAITGNSVSAGQNTINFTGTPQSNTIYFIWESPAGGSYETEQIIFWNAI